MLSCAGRVYEGLQILEPCDRNDEKLMEENAQKQSSYFTDPEKQKVLRFAMQRPANYLTEIETYLEKALAEALEGEKTA